MNIEYKLNHYLTNGIKMNFSADRESVYDFVR